MTELNERRRNDPEWIVMTTKYTILMEAATLLQKQCPAASVWIERIAASSIQGDCMFGHELFDRRARNAK